MRITAVCALVGLALSPAAFAASVRHLSGALYGREGKSPAVRQMVGDATEKPFHERSSLSQARGRAGRDVPIAAGVAGRSLDLDAHAAARSLEDRGDVKTARQPHVRDPGIVFRSNNHVFRRADGDLD